MDEWVDFVDSWGGGSGEGIAPGENDPDDYKNNKGQLRAKNSIRFTGEGLD